jgi:hypothetical protein
MEQLKKEYIASKTKGWDDETKERYIYEIEEDFKQFYEGYKYAMNECRNEVLPVLQFIEGKIDSEAGIFQQTVKRLILKLKSF